MEKPKSEVTASTSLPPVQELFSESWLAFKKTCGKLLLLYLVTVISFLVLFGVAALFLVLSGIGAGSLFTSKTPNLGALIPFILVSGIFLILILIAGIIMGAFMQMGTILIAYDYNKKISFSHIFTKTLSLLIPISIIALYIDFFIFGSFFVFVIPAIVVSILLSFAINEAVIENVRGLTALRRSLFIVKSHFWEIIVRIILVWVLSFIISGVFSFAQASAKESIPFHIVITILSLLFNMVMSLFTTVYSIILYKHAKAAVPAKKESSLRVLFIIALIGWILVILIGIGIYKVISSGVLQDAFKKAAVSKLPTVQKQLSEDVMSPQAKLHYEKSAELFDQIQKNKDNPAIVTKLSDQNIDELLAAIKIEPQNAVLWNSLGDAYTWQNTKGTTDDALAAYKKAESLEPSNTIYMGSVAFMLNRMGLYDAAVLQYQKVLRINENSAPNQLGIAQSYANLKLYDQARDHYKKAIDIYTRNNTNGRYDAIILEAQKDLAALPK